MEPPIDTPERSKLFLLLFTNTALLCSIALAWIGFSIALSIRKRARHWFARSGAILAIVGGTLTCRNFLRLTPEERHGIVHMTMLQEFTPGELADQEKDFAAGIIGVVLLVSGSLIWANGDLLGRRPTNAARGSTSTNDPAATRAPKTT